MYEAFYGLKEKPFNLTPDPRFLFLSEKHKEAFAHLLFGIKNRTGFVMVSGEIGTGKTTICRTLLNRLDSDTEVAFIFNPCLSPLELLKKINEEFGIKSRGETVKDLIDELNQYLLERFAEGKNCVLVIDEAQDLTPGVLEQIRLLSNLETETQKLLQIVLIGQPELMQHLSLPELRQLDQRITARYHLNALDRSETLQYIAYRLRVAGGRNRVWFTPGAIKAIYRASGGIPRVINAVCDRALLIGYTQESRDITKAHIRQAVREIKGERPKRALLEPIKRYLPSPGLIGAALIILLVGRYFVAPFAEKIRFDFSSGQNAAGENVRSFLSPSPVDATVPSAQPSSAVSENLPSAPAENLNVLDTLAPEQLRNAAAISLLRAWKQAMISDYPKADTPDALTAFASENGMLAEALPLLLNQLEIINMPAFVRLACRDHVVWAGLLALDEEDVVLASSPLETVSISRDEFGRRYLNQAVIIWRDPAPRSAVLRTGYTGPEVAALQDKLFRLGRLKTFTRGTYDQETAAAVTTVQQEAGLKQDGVAGRQVRMVISSWMGQEGFPFLKPRDPVPEVVADVPQTAVDQVSVQAAVDKPTANPAEEKDSKPEEVPASLENTSENNPDSADVAPDREEPAETEPPEKQTQISVVSENVPSVEQREELEGLAPKGDPNEQEPTEQSDSENQVRVMTEPSISGVPLVPHEPRQAEPADAPQGSAE